MESMQRYRSIDILRGLAIILMIQVHFVENLSSGDGAPAWLYLASTYLGSIPAPFFAFVSGLSYALWLRKQESLRRRDEEITKITLRRGLFLFGIGIAFNFFVWLPEETFNWDILTLLGTSLLFLAFARKLPPPVLALICLLVILFSPLLRVVGDYNAYWIEQTYTYDFTFRDILFGFLANGFFPVFPWIIFPILGFLCADLVFRRRASTDAIHWRLWALGFGLLALSALIAKLSSALIRHYAQQPLQRSHPWEPWRNLSSTLVRHYGQGFSEFPASTVYVLAMLGFILISSVLLHRWVDRKADGKGDGPLMTVIGRFSVFSLTVYILHHAVILWPLWIYGVWKGHDDPTHYWRAMR